MGKLCGWGDNESGVVRQKRKREHFSVNPLPFHHLWQCGRREGLVQYIPGRGSPPGAPNAPPDVPRGGMVHLQSRATMSLIHGPPLSQLLSFCARILLLLLCGHASSTPVEHPGGSVQYPLGTTRREGLDAKVLILGAGVAGITAAQRLESYGISDFLIVEAHHEVGGRLRNRNFGSSNHVHSSPPTTSPASDTLKSIEVGAQWIQGYHEDNPI